MKVVFLKSDSDREEQLTEAMARGVQAQGDQFKAMLPPKEPCELDADIVGFVGMKRHDWFSHCKRTGKRLMYFDKGYYHRGFKGREHIILWRVSVDAHQPLEYVTHARHGPNRWLKLQRPTSPWRQPTKADGHILVANSSEKYHNFFGLPHPTEWVREVVRELRKHTDRPIWYRPKPSWRAKTPIKGTRYCPEEPVLDLFVNCHALVTHGSYISVDALLAGVPAIILGDAVTRHVSSTSLAEIENPRLASDEERLQLLSNLAWCQFRIEEWETGYAWASVKRLFLQ